MRGVVVFLVGILVASWSKSEVDSAKILGMFPLPVRSHYLMYEKLMKELVNRGHEVYVVSHFPKEKNISRYHDISIKGSTKSMEHSLSIEEAHSISLLDSIFTLFKDHGRDLCEDVLKHEGLLKLKDMKLKFDLMIMEVHGTDCLIGFAQHFNVPVIGISAAMYLPWALERMGNPDNPSYMPSFFAPRNGPMELNYKIEKVAVGFLAKIGYYMLSTIPSEMRAREFFGNDLKPLDELASNTTLLLVNTHFSINDPKPTVPTVIEIGGMHIDPKRQPLPKKLQDFINEPPSQDVIYVSMSTVLDMTSFDGGKLNILINTLSKLPYKIILRKDIVIPNKYPKNIYVDTLLPQVDILCHPKTKLFITSGGLMSTHEAAYCGVPIIGIPFTVDQRLNVQNFVSRGCGESLDYQDLNAEKISATLDKMLDNTTYHINVKELSKKFKDRPMDILSTAVYWVEYVIKYGGAPHLRTRSADMIWYEYFSVDVALVFFVLAVLWVAIMIFILNFLQNYFEVKEEDLKKIKQKRS